MLVKQLFVSNYTSKFVFFVFHNDSTDENNVKDVIDRLYNQDELESEFDSRFEFFIFNGKDDLSYAAWEEIIKVNSGRYQCIGNFHLDVFDLASKIEEENIFRKLAHIVKTESGERKIPVVAAKGSANWIDEEGPYVESDDEFGQVSIGAYKLGTTIKVSEELINDSVFDLEGYISKEFARRIGNREEDSFFNGDGSGKPLGILAAKGGAELGVTAASATAITADELIDLFYSLNAPYRKNAVWVLNDATIKAIRKLKDNNGNYLWQESLTAGAPGTILGRPVFTSSYMPTIAAGKKVIAFGDFNYYWIADRQGRSFKRLNELYAATGQVGFIANQRVDGKLILPEAIKVLAMKSGSAS